MFQYLSISHFMPHINQSKVSNLGYKAANLPVGSAHQTSAPQMRPCKFNLGFFVAGNSLGLEISGNHSIQIQHLPVSYIWVLFLMTSDDLFFWYEKIIYQFAMEPYSKSSELICTKTTMLAVADLNETCQHCVLLERPCAQYEQDIYYISYSISYSISYFNIYIYIYILHTSMYG